VAVEGEEVHRRIRTPRRRPRCLLVQAACIFTALDTRDPHRLVWIPRCFMLAMTTSPGSLVA
jgi:hypothetical protein